MKVYMSSCTDGLCVLSQQVETRVAQDIFEALTGLLDCVMIGLPSFTLSNQQSQTPEQEQVREQVRYFAPKILQL